jgi:hypothetical protein
VYELPTAPLVPGRPAWCAYIGKVLERFGCPCHIRWRYACEVHGQCFLQPNKDEPAVANCRDCEQYAADNP